jgi:cytochrome c peroxidase
MKPLDLTAQEKSDLVAFLKSLSSNLTPTAAPVLPR